ncbi:MAG TPA: T9SS type A sorting domain-containing protein [Saprospiraceae bacterium]|nr:T9SS type A sorting domain-containing protein [Saprospiraceae bacterium]
MKRICLIPILLLIMAIAGKTDAQTIFCYDITTVSLNPNCEMTLTPGMILLNPPFEDYVLDVDKTPPFGDGPWETTYLDAADVGHTYQVRAMYVPTGATCTGLLEVQDKWRPVLQCNQVSTVTLTDGNPVTVATTDLSLTATDACGGVTLSPDSLEYTCDSLGIHTIQLTATDESGNTATCQHTVLVNSPTGCQECVAACPESVTVSYTEGNLVLLPAFQNNDWSLFDPYGNAALDPACTALDSTYTIEFQAGASTQNWFTRRWHWLDGAGQPVECEQTITFPNTHAVTVQGKVYIDADGDCIPDAGESGLNYFPIKVIKQPSGQINTIYPNADGTYTAVIDFSVADVSAQLFLNLPGGVNSVCPSAILVPNTPGAPAYNFDIGLHVEGNCALMQVDVGAYTTRSCYTNSYLVQYCNAGLDTAFDASISLHLDPRIFMQSAGLPYTIDTAAASYVFHVGDVPPFQCNYFFFTAFTKCSVDIGQTLCNEVTAYPNTPCGEPSENVFITTTANCTGDTVSLAIWNHGQLDMTTPYSYIVVEDFIMYDNNSFQLDAGDSLTIKVPANGSTWRIEAQQSPDYPEVSVSVAAVEGCGGLNTPGLINAFSQYDNQGYYDLDCFEVTASVDPNDKTAVPTGYGDEHFIRANEQIEYQIRFQNTGTDTAFLVEIVDTLSPLLDPLSLEVGAASHPYRLDVYEGGIIHFVFDPIALPDSNANEAASHGMVQFRIAQKPGLSDGSVIENTAAIYFDNNAPVFTNTTFHTIGYPFLTVSTWTPYTPGVEVSLAPNPFRDQTVLTVKGKQLSQGRVLLYDLHGRLIQTVEMADNRAVLRRGVLPAGIYFFQITEHGVGVGSGKVEVD